MSVPVRVSSVPPQPAEPAALKRPAYRLPADAIPPAELAVIEQRDPVDVAAARAWLDGTGADPWTGADKR
ncbi:MAG TPA: hypothetical protein VJN18_14115 [Polyangiaceae bacterium]|nr:hypothetical protein [Polyangiaceae bacterium]